MIIDSHGNPGIAGRASGVVAAVVAVSEDVSELVWLVTEAIGVTVCVMVSVADELVAELSIVTVVELVADSEAEVSEELVVAELELVAADVELVVTDDVALLDVEVAVVGVDVVPVPYKPGGSRWKARASVPAPALSPTAKPFVLDVRNTLTSDGVPVLGTGVVNGI